MKYAVVLLIAPLALCVNSVLAAHDVVACGPDSKKDDACLCKITDLRPTQISVGMIEVEQKEKDIAQKSKDKIEKFKQRVPLQMSSMKTRVAPHQPWVPTQTAIAAYHARARSMGLDRSVSSPRN